jgi:hypothetical protein
VRVIQWFVCCVVFCRLLFVLLAIVFSVLLTAFDYTFGILTM